MVSSGSEGRPWMCRSSSVKSQSNIFPLWAVVGFSSPGWPRRAWHRPGPVVQPALEPTAETPRPSPALCAQEAPEFPKLWQGSRGKGPRAASLQHNPAVGDFLSLIINSLDAAPLPGTGEEPMILHLSSELSLTNLSWAAFPVREPESNRILHLLMGHRVLLAKSRGAVAPWGVQGSGLKL